MDVLLLRTSNDIQAFAEAWFWNLQTVLPFLDPLEPLSQPHCWAYPGDNSAPACHDKT